MRLLLVLLCWAAPCRAQVAVWELGLPALKGLLQDPPASQAGMAAAPAAPREAQEASLRQLFARPLIAGASISADFKTASPGRLIARRADTESALVSVARAGATGSTVVAALKDSDLTAATIIVGVDLFFWDAARDCGEGLAAVDSFFEKAKPHRTPIVIGNIPALHGDTVCREKLNARITAACAAAQGCFLLDLDRMFKDASAPAGLLSEGKRYPLEEILCDGLHLSATGSQIVARKIMDGVLPISP